MQNTNPPLPSSAKMGTVGTMNGLPTAPVLPPAAGDCVERALDPKMTVMCGGDKEKAADYANCESQLPSCRPYMIAFSYSGTFLM